MFLKAVLIMIHISILRSEMNISDYYKRRLNEWTWLTSHNSHLNWADNGVIYLASNQNLSIDQQLNAGVRGFMFDIDLKSCTGFEKLLDTCGCEGICLCHGKCTSDSIKDGFSVKSLEYALKKIVRFLVKNKNELITLFFEDYIPETKLLQDVFDKIKSFNNLVFNPYSKEWNVVKNGWPKIGDMVKANKRILIVDDEQRALHARKRPGFIRSRDFLIQNHYEWFNDRDEWNISDISNDTLSLISPVFLTNRTSLDIDMSRCFSLHKTNNQPNWNENKILDLQAKEFSTQLSNSEKLFLFNHFYGVAAKANLMNPITVNLMNNREFVLKRLNEKCNPGVNGKKPNYIAVDFIQENTLKELIEPFNKFIY